MARWIGYAVSVSCGEPLGCYQGTILQADGGTITLTKAFRNGFPYPKSQVTLNASDIKELKIIEARVEPASQTHSTVAVTKNGKKGSRATVCENLQANPSSSGNLPTSNNAGANKSAAVRSSSSGQMARSKPIDIQGPRTNNKNSNNNHSGSGGGGGGGGSTPRARGGGGGGGGGGAARRRNEAAFGLAAEDPELEQDFDFEKNLALFDKQALWDQMRNAHKPDLVRQTEGCGKFRHDENVLGGGAPAPALSVPSALRGHMDYVTDEGVVFPSVTGGTRAALWAALAAAGLAPSAELLLARAAADVALRLVGGARRLEPRNTHQAPAVVALVGCGLTGACGVSTARLLASHGVLTSALRVRPAPPPCPALQAALALYAAAGGELAASPRALPRPDLVLIATDADDEAAPEYAAALSWLAGCRAGAVRIEPGPGGGAGGAGGEEPAARASVWAALPGEWREALGRVYVANVAAPPALLAALGLRYRPPYGERAALPLHPRDD